VQSWISAREARGVLVGALQSEREEETHDRAERGSAVMGSGRPLAGTAASVAPEEEVIHGRPVKNTEALANPQSLRFYERLEELRS